MRIRVVQSGSRVAAVLCVPGILYAAIATVVSAVLPAPGAVAVLSVVAFWLHALTARGYRRVPFWTAALTGSTIILIAVGFGWTGNHPAWIEYLSRWTSACSERTGGLSGRIAPVHQGFVLILGLGSFVVARITMTRTFLRGRRFAVTFPGAIVALAATGLLIPAGAGTENLIAYRGELDELIMLLDPRYRNPTPEVRDYLEEIARDESLSREEQEALVRDLNREIETLENEIQRFRVVEAERETYADEMERLRGKLEAIEESALLTTEDLQPVESYQDAVRPAIPVVRDFAAGLAGQHPGSYHRSRPAPTPSRTGIKQVLAIHRYVAGRWRYVNDPLYIRGNYYSPPERTISTGFVGDCDDFAIMIASAVEAIGGTTRILHGTCDEGAHAWAEVYIGDDRAWQGVIDVLSGRAGDRSITRRALAGDRGYWLSLDWRVGTYTCGDSPVVWYTSGEDTRHAPAFGERVPRGRNAHPREPGPSASGAGE